MKQQYNWDYTIRVKTKEGTFEYEDKLENVDKILEKHPNYEEIQAKKLVKRRSRNGIMDKKPR